MKPASHQEREHFQHSRKIPSPPFPSAPPTPPTESCRQGRVVPLLALNVAGLPQWGPGRVLSTQARLPVPAGVRASLCAGKKMPLCRQGPGEGLCLQRAELPPAQGHVPAPGLSWSRAVFAFGGLSTGCTVLCEMTGE